MELIGETKKVILLELDKKNSYGYELSKTLTLPLSTIYGHLKDLKQLGLISEQTDDRKIIYKLTDKGRQFVEIIK